MNKEVQRIRTLAKLRQVKECKACKDCKDCEECKECLDKPLKFTMSEIQDIGEFDRQLVFTRCVLDPKIVMKKYGEQGEDEVPYEFVDADTGHKLFQEIQNYSLEVFEGVDFDSFPVEQDGQDTNEDGSVLQHTSEPVSGLLSPEDESSVKDEIGRILRESDGDEDEGSAGRTRRDQRKSQRKKRKTRNVQNNNKK